MIRKGRLISMTELSNFPYQSTNKYGVVFIKESIDINDEAREKFMQYVDCSKRSNDGRDLE